MFQHISLLLRNMSKITHTILNEIMRESCFNRMDSHRMTKGRVAFWVFTEEDNKVAEFNYQYGC